MPTELCSESFILVGIHEAVAFIKRKNEFLFINEVVDDDDIDDDDDDDKYMNSSGDRSFTTPNVPREVYCKKHKHISVSNNIGPATIYIVNEDDKKKQLYLCFSRTL